MKNINLVFRPTVETKILQELNSAGSDLGDYLISKMKHLTKTSDLTKLRKKMKISSVRKWNFNNNRSEPVKYPVTWQKIYICVFTSKNGFWLKIQLLKFWKFRPRSRIGQLRNQKLRLAQTKTSFSGYHPVLQKSWWIFCWMLPYSIEIKIWKFWNMILIIRTNEKWKPDERSIRTENISDSKVQN